MPSSSLNGSQEATKFENGRAEKHNNREANIGWSNVEAADA